ncbi:MAG: hypothetical protein HN350_06445 [Phycisphaerales bacterium]|jgi:hypothetical protein|nr:hypothetical protein [Phycisphaerales bacterium]
MAYVFGLAVRPWFINCSLLLLAVLCIPPAQAAGRDIAERKIVLREHLGLNWADEVVGYPFSADKGRCKLGAVMLTGPDGPQACQLSDVVFWDGTEFVKSARLSFLVAKLKAQTTQIYTVAAGASKHKTDLAISTKGDHIEANVAKFGVRLLTGKKVYARAVPAAKAPGPVLGMRLADGTWFGSSVMFGKTSIASYDARVIDSGPVFVRVRCVYAYVDGNTLEVITVLNAGGAGVTFETRSAKNQPSDGWDLLLGPGLGELTLQFPAEAAGKQPQAKRIEKTGWRQRAVSEYRPGAITKLSPWGDWWNEFTQPDIYLQFAGGKGELALVRRSADRWVEPVKSGSARFGYFEPKTIPLIKQASGEIAMHVNNAAGVRVWSVSQGDDPKKKLAMYPSLKGPASGPMLGLDAVKDMVLDWPDGPEKHPRLIMSAAEMATAAKANPDAMTRLTNEHSIKQMEGFLVRMGEFDLMRKIGNLAGQYDAIIDSGKLTAPQRKLIRARMAYLAYYAASPANWSPPRGYRSGNPNMTIAHTLNQGVLACLLKGHPMAKTWSAVPTRQMRYWIAKTVDDDGYWNESSHYARVSISKLLFYAIAARRAGLADFLTDEKFKKMNMLYERLLTPGDPQRELPVRAVKGKPKPSGPGLFPRVSAPHGRGERGDRWGMGGLLARGYRKLDPQYSAIMQWSWNNTGRTYIIGEGMGGLERLYADSNLPARTPKWRSEYIRRLGYLMRSGVGSQSENFLLFISQFATNPDGEIWPSETGAITKWFAHGVPISGAFNGYPYSNLHSMLLNRVTPAASYKPGGKVPATGFIGKASQGGLAALPRLDYASASFTLTKTWSRVFTMPKAAPAFPQTARAGGLPITWRRQVLSIKGDNPGGVGYVILRDTIAGKQPTQWRFWTLSKTLAPAADPPGAKIVGPSELKGDRFTAVGQFGVDLEYYIASPTRGPRHTLRYGLKAAAADIGRYLEYQDMLQLTLPGDGAYFVAMFPRKSKDKAPAFATSADGKVITIKGAWGVDHTFLTDEPAEAKIAGFSFKGTSACVQNRTSGLVLTLGDKGSVAGKAYSLTAPFAASLRVGPAAITIDMSPDHPVGEIIITAPGKWRSPKSTDGTYKITVAVGKTMLKLIKAN